MNTGDQSGSGETFGGLLRRYRAAAVLTQENLAERAGLSVRGLRYLEGDLRRPYRDTVQRLVEALSLAPDDRARLVAAARPRIGAAQSEPDTQRPVSLPVPAGPLIGRERELRALVDLLQNDEVRVVTITGTGGVGKTSLAIHAAAELRSIFRGVVVWLPLVELTDWNLVPSALARALGLLAADPVGVRNAILQWIGNQPVLLVLDNFEHVAAAAPLVSELVTVCPRLKVLVTSRVPLRLRSEYEFAVSPLSLPEPSNSASVYAIAANPAVSLFLRRAQAIKPEFVLTQTNAVAVATICRRLEGLPLALELAAARIRVLTPAAMLKRLDHRIAFLTGGGPDMPARQRTMRETIAWSYDLLDPSEQFVFRRLSVFAGTCDLAAVQAVCNLAGELETDSLDLVEGLHRSSLLQVDDSTEDEPRLAMLETVREFALEQLDSSAETRVTRKRHADYFLEFAEAGAQQLYAPEQGVWLHRLERDHANFRAALDWCIETRNAEMGLRLCAALWFFWYVRGYATEGRMQIRKLLELPDVANVQAARAEALLGAGQLAQTQGDYSAARMLLDDSIALFRSGNDERGVARALLASGFCARIQEDYVQARLLLEEALSVSRSIGYDFITAASLHHLGMISMDADQDYPAARLLLQEALRLYRELRLPRSSAQVLITLADLGRTEGALGQARDRLDEAVGMMIDVGEKLGLQHALDTYAELALEERLTHRAARLAGAAARLRQAMGMSSWPAIQRGREQWLQRMRTALGEQAFRLAWEEGEAMTSDQAIAYALEPDD